MSQQPEASRRGPGVRLMPQLPEPLVYALGGLFILGAMAVLAVLFPAELRFRRKKKPKEFQLYHEPPKVSLGVYVTLVLVMLLPIGLVVWLYWSGWQPLGAGHGQQQATPPARMAPLPQTAPPDRPAVAAPGFAWTLFILAAVVGLGMLGGGAWFLFGDRLESWWYGIPCEEARQALLEAVEISLDDLLRAPDPRWVVITCYRRLEQVLEQHGLPRAPWQTPVEYLHIALRRFRLPTVCLRELTTLFELAKFSTHALGTEEKQAAITALRTVKMALEEANRVPTT
jgi:hypothetical protein